MKKKVLVVSVSPKARGGVATVVNTFRGSHTLNSKFDVEYFSSHDPSTLLGKVISPIISYLVFPFKVFNTDLVHVHGSMKTSFFRKSPYLFMARLLGKPVIYHMHAANVEHYFNHIPLWKSRLVSKVFSYYDLRLCLGTPWASKLEGLTSSTWNILHNPMKPGSRSEHHVKGNAITSYVFLGELSKRKGITDLLDAFAKAVASSPSITLSVAGSGDIEGLKAKCKELGIEDKVDFVGWIGAEAKHQLLMESDVVVLPSYAEGLPMSVLEAMSYGKVVITTPVGATEDAIQHNVNGILVPPGDIDGLASAISRTANEDVSSLADQAYLDFNKSFHVEKIAERLADYYQELLCN